MKTQTVTSAGGVVCDDQGNILMIARRSLAGELQWTLPKGLVESGESAESTARREVEEETGFEAEITGPPHTIDYWFVWKPDDARYHKFVKYFPMRPTGKPQGTPDGEAEAVEWVPASEAVRRASFRNEQGVLEHVLAGDLSARRTETESMRPASSRRKRAGA